MEVIPVVPVHDTKAYHVAALYVDTSRGPYPRIPGVDCWGYGSRDGQQLGMFCAGDRDARKYRGTRPVVAHPPCGPWGRFEWNYQGGEGDRSCGPAAVEQVRHHGGVLEHPSESKLWQFCGMPRPGEVDAFGGYTIEVDQCDWGHPCRKRTWLYIVGCAKGDIPAKPGPARHTMVMVRLRRNGDDFPELPKRFRHLTPWRFAVWLCEIAQKANVGGGSRIGITAPARRY